MSPWDLAKADMGSGSTEQNRPSTACMLVRADGGDSKSTSYWPRCLRRATGPDTFPGMLAVLSAAVEDHLAAIRPFEVAAPSVDSYGRSVSAAHRCQNPTPLCLGSHPLHEVVEVRPCTSWCILLGQVLLDLGPMWQSLETMNDLLIQFTALSSDQWPPHDVTVHITPAGRDSCFRQYGRPICDADRRPPGAQQSRPCVEHCRHHAVDVRALVALWPTTYRTRGRTTTPRPHQGTLVGIFSPATSPAVTPSTTGSRGCIPPSNPDLVISEVRLTTPVNDSDRATITPTSSRLFPRGKIARLVEFFSTQGVQRRATALPNARSTVRARETAANAHGVPAWVDVNGAKAFYGTVFGWGRRVLRRGRTGGLTPNGRRGRELDSGG